MKKIFLSLLAAISLGSTGCSAQSDGINVLSPKDFIKQAKADTTSIILDVRTPGEYKEEHLAGARQLDFSIARPSMQESNGSTIPTPIMYTAEAENAAIMLV